MKIHIVQKGDTLWNIAKKYGVNFDELKKINAQLSNPDMIMPGMKIKVPDSGGTIKKEAIAPKKEMPVKEHPLANQPPQAQPIKEAPKKELPKKVEGVQFAPKMPKPLVSDIDINNYYMINMENMSVEKKEFPNIPPKPKAVLPGAKKEIPIAPVAPIKEAPVQPIKEKPVAPIMEKPVLPIKEKPIAPIAEKPIAPIAEKPIAPFEDNIAPFEDNIAPIQENIAPLEEYSVPVTPVLPGSGLCPPPPPCPPGFGPMPGYFAPQAEGIATPPFPMFQGVQQPFPNQMPLFMDEYDEQPFDDQVMGAEDIMQDENIPYMPFSQYPFAQLPTQTEPVMQPYGQKPYAPLGTPSSVSPAMQPFGGPLGPVTNQPASPIMPGFAGKGGYSAAGAFPAMGGPEFGAAPMGGPQYGGMPMPMGGPQYDGIPMDGAQYGGMPMPMGGPQYGGMPMPMGGPQYGGMPMSMGGPQYGGMPMPMGGSQYGGMPMGGSGYPMTSPQDQGFYEDEDDYQGTPYAPMPQVQRAVDDCGCGGPKLMPNGYPIPYYPQGDVAPFGAHQYGPNLYGPEPLRDHDDQ